MVLSKSKSSKAGSQGNYRAPALDRGLDILELLSNRTQAVSQSRIARELGRSSSEVFRMLSCLVDRGYVTRSDYGDGYVLTMRLHQLVQNWPLLKHYIESSLPEMHRLTEQVGQSCHLGVYNTGRMHVAVQVASPAPVGVTVKVAVDYSLVHTASGRVLLAWQSKKIADHWITASEDSVSKKTKDALYKRLGTIHKRGYELSNSDVMRGLTDISCPILDTNETALAALTMPYLHPLSTRKKIENVILLVRQSAKTISKTIRLVD